VSKSPPSTSFSAARTDTTGSATPRAACQVTNRPTASDSPPSASVVMASWVSETSRPASDAIATSASPKIGTPVPSAQADSDRVTTPRLTGSRGARLESARATVGRIIRSLSR
jgi:hypothetical protein